MFRNGARRDHDTGPAPEALRLVKQVVGSLKVAPADAAATIDELIASGLLAPHEPAAVRLTDSGREKQETVTAETAAISTRIYAGIPASDLAVAGRVLALVTERADAELAAATGGPR